MLVFKIRLINMLYYVKARSGKTALHNNLYKNFSPRNCLKQEFNNKKIFQEKVFLKTATTS